MSREIDTRDFTTSRVTPNRTQQLHAAAANISNQLAGAHRVRIAQFNAVTGNPSAVVSDNAATEVGDYVRRALEHVQVIGPALGLAAQPAEFLADPQVQKTNSDARAVNLQQRYKGIPIFQAAVTVRFDPKGTLTDTVGDTVSVGPDLPVAPQLSVQQAVLRAAEHVATPPPDEQGVKDQFGESLMPPQVT